MRHFIDNDQFLPETFTNSVLLVPSSLSYPKKKDE